MPVSRKEVREGVDPRTLNFDPLNPRKMAGDNRERLDTGLDEFGLVTTLTVRGETGVIIGGNQRLQWAVDRGEPVDVTYVYGLTDEEAATLGVLLNNPNAMGEWDFAKLGPLLSEIDARGHDATLSGFDEEQLARIIDYQQRPDRTGSEPATPPEPSRAEESTGSAGEAGTGGTDFSGMDPGEDRYKEQYGVIVICNDEQHQAAVYDRLVGEGLKVKVVVT